MTIAVVENPDPRPFMWSFPEGRNGIPRGQVEFQNSLVSIGASTAEDRTILISCALPQGYAYRLQSVNMDIAGAANTDLQTFGQNAFVTLGAFVPSAPALTLRQAFPLPAAQPIRDTSSAFVDRGYASITDASAVPFKLQYSGLVPNTILNAQSGTTLMTIQVAANDDTSTECFLGYYARFLVYDIADENKWAINTPQPVTF